MLENVHVCKGHADCYVIHSKFDCPICKMDETIYLLRCQIKQLDDELTAALAKGKAAT